jgi:hypothetical protein
MTNQATRDFLRRREFLKAAAGTLAWAGFLSLIHI